MTEPAETVQEKSFVDSLRMMGLRDGIGSAIREHHYTDDEIEPVHEFIKGLPYALDDSGGDMACDESPNFQNNIWAEFVAAMVVEGRAVAAVEAMAEIQSQEIRQRAALAVATLVASRMPSDGR